MSETINSLDVYVVTIDGTATQYIRTSIVDVVAADTVLFDARETAAASVAGTQNVDFGGAVTGGGATGLTNDATTYTCSISIDGTDYAVSVVGSASQTFTNLVTEINADLPNTECAIAAGDLLLTSTTTGNDSKIAITDTDLFSSLTGFVEIDAAVDGDLRTDLMGQTLGNGANAWAAYGPSVETYDTAADDVVISADETSLTDSTGGTADGTVADNGATYVQADTNNNLADLAAKINALVTKVNALQDIVEARVLRKG